MLRAVSPASGDTLGAIWTRQGAHNGLCWARLIVAQALLVDKKTWTGGQGASGVQETGPTAPTSRGTSGDTRNSPKRIADH